MPDLINKEPVKIFAHQLFLKTKSTTWSFQLCNYLYFKTGSEFVVRRKSFLKRPGGHAPGGQGHWDTSLPTLYRLALPQTRPPTDSSAPRKNIWWHRQIQSQTRTYLMKRSEKCDTGNNSSHLLTQKLCWVLYNHPPISPAHSIK